MRIKEATIFTLGLIMGTGSTIIAKVIYDIKSEGLNGRFVGFGKPLMQTWLMFIGMSLAMPLHWIEQRWAASRRESKADKTSLVRGGINDDEEEDDGPIDVSCSTYMSLAIPAAFDLVGTALSGVGLLYCTVSVYQLVRCTVIIVTAVLKATVLKHKIAPYAWFGLLINTVAMALVSSTTFFQATHDDTIESDPRIGIFFILMSCVVQGAQYVFEERVMSFNAAPPLVVVGMEGVWGGLFMPLIVLPLAYYLPGTDNGHIEDTWDSIEMMKNSSFLFGMLMTFTAIVFFYNVFCIYVTFLLDSIWHAILDNFRPVSVWTIDLLLFYIFTDGAYGESWGFWSWLELAGMIALFYGTAVYNGSTKLSCFQYPAEGDEEDDIPATIASPFTPSSPRLQRRSTPGRGTPIGKKGLSSRASVAYGSTNA